MWRAMTDNLVIVESPAKAHTIQNFLGKDFTVKSSFGHIRDLQEKTLSVDVENGFKPEYVVPDKKKKVVTELKKLASESKAVWLASDEDREGEAISWHLAQTLGLDPATTKRIVFHEITKDAILNAVQNPRTINMNLVNAQQARRVLDRLVGFELSPVLWRKVQRGLSAGRVQSVALRLIVDKEREIMAFVPKQYYKIEGNFTIAGTKVKGQLDTRFDTLDDARSFLQDSIGASYSVASVDVSEGTRYPAAPFTTSTLQQEAARKLHLPVSQTMRVAQSLYERGLITYMRTDSTNLSSLALGTAKEYILNNFGAEYSHPRQYKTKVKGAQEAHEAIRPTYISNTEIEGTAQEKKLYQLIWKRTVASQMADAKLLNTSVKVATDKRSEQYSIQASQVLFDGFLKLYLEGTDDADQEEGAEILPPVKTGDAVNARSINAEGKFTQPPFRYSEATLIKKLEALEIGRPSTWATIISTLTTGRGYIIKGDKEGTKKNVTNLSLKGATVSESEKTETIGAERGKLLPQDIALIVTDYLTGSFSDIMDYSFTAGVENQLDQVAEGEMKWDKVISDFYHPFHNKVEEVASDKQYSHVERTIGTAPDGSILIAKFGQFGPYVQKGDGPLRQCASLAKGQLIENLTLEDALRLFELPRNLGQQDGIDIIAMKGRFGPYLKFGEKNVSIPKGTDPLKLSLEEALVLIQEAQQKEAAVAVIKEFPGRDISVINGRYGPYIKHGGSNYKIPRGTTPENLTEAECQKIIDSAPASKSKGGYKKTWNRKK